MGGFKPKFNPDKITFDKYYDEGTSGLEVYFHYDNKSVRDLFPAKDVPDPDSVLFITIVAGYDKQDESIDDVVEISVDTMMGAKGDGETYEYTLSADQKRCFKEELISTGIF